MPLFSVGSVHISGRAAVGGLTLAGLLGAFLLGAFQKGGERAIDAALNYVVGNPARQQDNKSSTAPQVEPARFDTKSKEAKSSNPATSDLGAAKERNDAGTPAIPTISDSRMRSRLVSASVPSAPPAFDPDFAVVPQGLGPMRPPSSR